MRSSAIALCSVLIIGCAGERPVLLDGAATNTNEQISESSVLGMATDVDADGDSDGSGSTTESQPTSTSTATAAAPSGVDVQDRIEAEKTVVLGSTGALGSFIDGELTDRPDGLNALISPTGVVLPVTGAADNGYTVTTPCGLDAFARWGQPLGPTQVVLDAGHGGDELGAMGDNGLTEAEVNLRVVRRAALELGARDYTVVLTRNADYRLPITQRAAIADALDARAFVSVHHNTPAAAPSDEPGTEVYVQTGSETSARLGGLIYEDVVAGLNRFDVAWVSRTDAGVMSVVNDAGEDAFGINRHPSVPAVLVEVAYLGNPAEARLMESRRYVDTIGVALADGVERFLTTDDDGSGFVGVDRAFNPSGVTGGTEGCIDPDLG